jgi:8-oxo-dGTP pyrophosphatase MutT (NUDIX family)
MTHKETDRNSPWPRIRLRSSVYVEKDGNVLLVFDPVYLGGCWILPGGEVEFEETTFQAAEREVFEETGLTVKTHSLWHLREIWEPETNFPNREGVIRRTLELIFLGDYISGNIDISHDPSHKPDGIPRVKQCRWFPICDLSSKIDGSPVYPEILYRDLRSNSYAGVSLEQLILDIVDMREDS